jgi:hypothetical protein
MSIEIGEPEPLPFINPIDVGVVPNRPNLNAGLIETYESRIARLQVDKENLKNIYIRNPIRTIGNLIFRLPHTIDRLEVLTTRHKALVDLKKQQPEHFPLPSAPVFELPPPLQLDQLNPAIIADIA